MWTETSEGGAAVVELRDAITWVERDGEVTWWNREGVPAFVGTPLDAEWPAAATAAEPFGEFTRWSRVDDAPPRRASRDAGGRLVYPCGCILGVSDAETTLCVDAALAVAELGSGRDGRAVLDAHFGD